MCVSLGGLKVAGIGPGTAEALRHYGLKTDLTPPTYRAESLAEATCCGFELQHSPFAILAHSHSRGREILAETLVGRLAVEQIVVYKSVDVLSPEPEVATLLKQGQIDWITVTSSAIAHWLARLFGDDLHRTSWPASAPSPPPPCAIWDFGLQPKLLNTRWTAWSMR